MDSRCIRCQITLSESRQSIPLIYVYTPNSSRNVEIFFSFKVAIVAIVKFNKHFIEYLQTSVYILLYKPVYLLTCMGCKRLL